MKIVQRLFLIVLLGLFACAGTGVSARSEGPRLRVFAAYSYFGADAGDNLPFGAGNARSLINTLSRGGMLTRTVVRANPSKKQLLRDMRACFQGIGRDEIALVYLCSHGHMTAEGEGYRLSLKGYDGPDSSEAFYLTSRELFDGVSSIPGRVVLLLDSCYSGVFIHDMRSELNALEGRVSVLTAALDTRASYCADSDPGDGLDLFTFFLLRGLGNGVFDIDLPADSDGDSCVTLDELNRFVWRSMKVNLEDYSRQPWFRGSVSQRSQAYLGINTDLVLFKTDRERPWSVYK